ncbi:hypothetical protein [Streptomyces sp. NPDC059092]|uniref:hypothetical protein n=1 Tax=Streptomyces sp. NPDC059092 TaxID=3346725 RepID=UPI003674CCF3
MAVQQWVRHHPHVMVMQSVLEISAVDDFALWPVGEHELYGYLVLNGELTPAEVGTAVRRIAAWKRAGGEAGAVPDRPAQRLPARPAHHA